MLTLQVLTFGAIVMLLALAEIFTRILTQLAKMADQLERLNTHGVHVREYPGSAFDPTPKWTPAKPARPAGKIGKAP